MTLDPWIVEDKTMGYFPNHTSGLAYQEGYCFRCANWCERKDDEAPELAGCPIWDLHLLWNYDAVGDNADTDKALALNLLIPMTEDELDNEECSLFVATKEAAEAAREGSDEQC